MNNGNKCGKTVIVFLHIVGLISTGSGASMLYSGKWQGWITLLAGVFMLIAALAILETELWG